MHPNIEQLYAIANKKQRTILGLMSGTSMDGLDIAMCQISGAGLNTKVQLIHFTTQPYSNAFKEKLQPIFSKQTVSLEQVCVMHPWIALEHAKMIQAALFSWEVSPNQIDIIASHGQTIYHAPKSLHPNDDFGNATLQIGDGDHLAVATGIITLSDFRQKHIAAGGEGAPLSLYGDYLLCTSPTENRVLLNIGGISNYTYLPAGGSMTQTFSSDTGPGNTLMDQYVRKFFEGKSYDKNGLIAQKGSVDNDLLKALLSHSFFSLGFPKTIGPELFNLEFIIAAQMSLGKTLSHEDVVATLNRFTAETIVQGLQAQLNKSETYTIYISGGGMHNPVLMSHLGALLPNTPIHTSNKIGILPDAKEAILFALLANEALAGNVLDAGAQATKQPTTMGKISFPN
jgi:anhydro-N-acetylmuramic acid kinase